MSGLVGNSRRHVLSCRGSYGLTKTCLLLKLRWCFGPLIQRNNIFAVLTFFVGTADKKMLKILTFFVGVSRSSDEKCKKKKKSFYVATKNVTIFYKPCFWIFLTFCVYVATKNVTIFYKPFFWQLVLSCPLWITYCLVIQHMYITKSCVRDHWTAWGICVGESPSICPFLKNNGDEAPESASWLQRRCRLKASTDDECRAIL